MTPMNQQPNARVGIGFTRHCFTCKKNKNASGGKINRRTQMWSCMSCQEELDLKWKSGPPPAIGWWPTEEYSGDALRWWNEKYWSIAIHPSASAKGAEYWACFPAPRTEENQIRWAHRPKDWPDRSKT